MGDAATVTMAEGAEPKSRASHGPVPALVVHSGPSLGDYFPFPTDASELQIGRAREMDFVLRHASVSRCHARITLVDGDQGSVEVTDLGSTNGTQVNGNVLFDVSQYDRILVIRKSGTYSVQSAPDKVFVDKGMLFCGLPDEVRVYTVVYKDGNKDYPHIKRCRIGGTILNRGYELVPSGCRVLKLTTDTGQDVVVEYKAKPRLRITEETFSVEDYAIRGNKAKGIRLAPREVKSAKFVTPEA